MLYHDHGDGTFTEWKGDPINGVPYRLEDLMSLPDTTLAKLGLVRPAPFGGAPSGKKLTNKRVELVDGVPTVQFDIVDSPVDRSEVNLHRHYRIMRGKTFDLSSGKSVSIQGDQQTRENLDALALAANLRLAQGLTDHITPYRGNDNVIHQLSPMEILELWQSAASFVEAVYAASWAIKDDPAGISPDFKEDPRWP